MSHELTLETLKASLEKHFGKIDDPRDPAKTAHQLLDIITIAVMAVLCGAEGWIAVETYGKAKQDWLSTFLALPNGIPSHDTFGRVFSLLNPATLEQHFQDWVKLMAQQLGLDLVAIDGKSINGSYDREEGIASLQMVSAWSVRQGLVLGQCAVDKKSNEISAIPILLEQLDLAGAIVTIDALGTQKTIAQQITDAGADYILTLKANHPQLAKQAQQWFEQYLQSPHDNEVVISSAVLTEGGHHRIEQRQFWQVPVTEVFADSLLQPWAGLQTLVVERSRRRLWSEETFSTRFFISSLPHTFSEFPNSIRSHWAIENSLHWCLDVVFAEDASRVRKDHSPHNLSILRRLALNLLRQDPSKGSLKMKRYRAALDNRFLLSILQHSHLF